jgi:hypothetical protein
MVPFSELLADLAGIGVFDLFENLEGSFGVRDGLRAICKPVEFETYVPQSDSFAPTIGRFSGQPECLLVMLNGTPALTQS